MVTARYLVNSAGVYSVSAAFTSENKSEEPGDTGTPVVTETPGTVQTPEITDKSGTIQTPEVTTTVVYLRLLWQLIMQVHLKSRTIKLLSLGRQVIHLILHYRYL